MLDLTPSIKLEPRYQTIYRWLQILVYAAFIFGFLYFGYIFFFPARNFFFSFSNSASSKNTILIKEDGQKDGGLTFDAILPPSEGFSSKAEIDFELDKNSPPIEEGNIAVTKSYQSFFYPAGDPIATPAENKPGFADGTLISYGESVFIVSGTQILPIDSPSTFESMGFNWSDVVPASSEEIEMYERGKLFTDKSPHPDGTIFAGRESGKYYLAQNGTKKELIGSDVIQSYLKKNPVLVDEKGLLKKNSCQLKEKSGLLGKFYACSILISGLNDAAGNDYRFEANFPPGVQIKELNLTFQKTANWNNLKLSLLNIKQKIVSRYYGN